MAPFPVGGTGLGTDSSSGIDGLLLLEGGIGSFAFDSADGAGAGVGDGMEDLSSVELSGEAMRNTQHSFLIESLTFEPVPLLTTDGGALGVIFSLEVGEVVSEGVGTSG